MGELNNFMQKLKHRLIPPLKKTAVKKGANYIEKRSFPTGFQNFFRVYENSTLPLSVTFKDPLPQLEVALYSNISGLWKDHTFEQINEREFQLNLTLERCGRFLFKVKYRFLGSQNWYWDTVPHTAFYVDPLSLKNLKMYTLIPNISGTIKDWITLLHHIKELGFNAVHMLPITQLDLSESPYSAHDLFTIDPNYGNPEDERALLDQFADFVETAKQLGIRLCVDLVMNHIGITSRMLKECPDWMASDESSPDSFKRAGCWDNHVWKTWGDLVLIKYDHPNQHIRYHIWQYMRDYALFWANYAAYTEGLVRFDNLHSMNPHFFQYLMKAIQKEFPRLLIFAELFSDQHTCERYVFESGIHMLLATPWVTPYAHQMREFLQFIHKVHNRIRYFTPLNSHDSGSPKEEFGDVMATIPRYLLCTILGTGLTGFTQGVEFGLPKKIQFIGLHPQMEITAKSWGHDFTGAVKLIHSLMEQYSYLQEGGNLQFVDQNHPAVIAGHRFNPSNQQEGFLVVVNLDTKGNQEIAISCKKCFPQIHTGTVINVITQEVVPVEKGAIKLLLSPCDYKIFKVN